MIVLYIGNELIPEDRAALETVVRIKKFFPKTDFVHCLSPEDILQYKNQEAIILDVAKGTDKITVVITVGDVNRPPVLSPIGNHSVTELETLLVNISVSDPDPEDKVQASVQPLPQGAIFSFDAATGTGQLRLIPTLGQAGTLSVTVFATDGRLSVSETITITINKDTTDIK